MSVNDIFTVHILIQKVYCGHEYSLQNLSYGAHVEPENKDVANKIAWCRSGLGERN